MKRKIIPVIIVLLFVTVLFSATYHVDGDYVFESTYNKKAIQTAVNAANSGDIILVHQYSGGVYGPVAIEDKGLTIKAYLTDIVYLEDGGTNTTCLEITHSCTTATNLEGLIIQNGNTISGPGGIYICGRRNVEIKDCIIVNNSGTGGGGLMVSDGAFLSLDGCEISDNTAISGGGIYICDSYMIMESVEILNNEALHGGGIFYRSLTTDCSCLGELILLTGNSATTQAGAIYIDTGTDEDNVLEFLKSTIAGNTSSNGLGGFYVYDQQGGEIDISINSSIVWGNDGTPQIDSGYDIDYSCIEQNTVYAGTDNTKGDPIFSDPSNGDYHLEWNSSCIDTGDPSLADDPDGTRIDMGYYTADDHDHWEFTESELGDETVIWRGLPRLDVGGANTGQFVNANDLLDRFEYPDNPSDIQLWFQQNSPNPDLYGYFHNGEYVWDDDPCEDLINSIRGFKFKVWGDVPEESQLLVFGNIINPLTAIEVDDEDDETWVDYFLPDTQLAYDAFDSTTLSKLEKVVTKNWTAVKSHDVWGWPGQATLTYGDLVILVPEEEEDDFSFYWQSSTRDDIEPYVRPVPTQFRYSEELEYYPIFMEFGENTPLEVGVYIDNVCKGAEVVDTDSLFHLRAYIMDEEPGQELEFVFYNGRSENQVMDYTIRDQFSSYNNNRLITGQLGEYACIEFTEPMGDHVPELEIDLKTFPNPFNPTITISFQAADYGNIDLEIYNVKGQKVKTLLNDHYCELGDRVSQIWKGNNDLGLSVSDGVYFVKMKSKAGIQTRKILLLK